MKLFVIILALFIGESHAASYESFITLKDTNATQLYLSGIYAGLNAANQYSGSNLGRYLYCPPSDSQHNYQDLMNLMVNHLNKENAKRSMDVEKVLLSSMIAAYPCSPSVPFGKKNAR